MAEQFVDRVSKYPNRYKITKSDGTTEYVTIDRADEATVAGTPLNATTFNNLISGFSETGHTHAAGDVTSGTFDTARIPTIPLNKGGTNATDGATGLKNLFAAGATVLSSNQYGDTLPAAGTTGRIFFKKVTE